MPKFTLTVTGDSFEEIYDWVQGARPDPVDPALTAMVNAINTATVAPEPTAPTQVQWSEPNGPVEDDGMTTVYPAVGDAVEPDPAVLFGDTVPTETDSRGMPWDERIHAGSKTTNADGTWRKKRGVTDEETRAVEIEIKGGHGDIDADAADYHATIEASQPAPVAPTDAPDYGTLCSVLSNAVKSGAVKGVDPLYQHVGISGLAECKDRPDLIVKAVDWVNAQCAEAAE